METRTLTCIVCPRGCEITVTLQNGKVTSVAGNSCPRGKNYAETECTAPVRTLTGTVAVSGGGVVPCRTTAPVPKKDIFRLYGMLNEITVPADLKRGDVILKDPLGNGADVIATASAEDNR